MTSIVNRQSSMEDVNRESSIGSGIGDRKSVRESEVVNRECCIVNVE
jgi:hypothetical protein